MANDLDVRNFGLGFVPAATATQNSDTLQAAIDSLQTNPNPGWTGPRSGHTIWIPAGIWLMRKQIRIFRPVRLIGAGSSVGATRLEWVEDAATWNMHFGTVLPNPTTGEAGNLALDSSAIVVVGNEAGYFTGDYTSNGSHFILENITLASKTVRQGELKRGITIRAGSCRLENVEIGNFPDNGISLEGYALGKVWDGNLERAGEARAFNAGGCSFYDVEAIANGGHGFFATGEDSNVCIYVRCRGYGNLGAQFYDNSFFGSTYIMCQADGAEGAGDWGFYANRDSSPTGTAFVGCYNESSAPSHFTGAVHVIGGAVGAITSNSQPGSMRTHGEGGYAVAKPEVYVSNFSHYPRWYPNHQYEEGDIVYSPDEEGSETGHLFKVIVIVIEPKRKREGRSGDPYKLNKFEEPAWNRATGATTLDGIIKDGILIDGIEWKCVENYINKNPTVFMPGGLLTPRRPSEPWRSAYAFGEFTRGRGTAGGAVITHYELVNGVDGKGRWTMYWGASREPVAWAYDLTDEGITYPRRGAFILPEVFVGDRNSERRFYVSYDGEGRGGRVAFHSVGDFVTNATWSAGSPAQPWAWRVRRPGALPPSAQVPGYTTRTDNTDYNVGDCVVDPSSPGNVFRCIIKGRSGTAPPPWNTAEKGETKDGAVLTWVYHGFDHDVIEPLPRQADAQADSTATDIDALRADFNALLQTLRDAHVIATD
jgi:hypothetical protein